MRQVVAREHLDEPLRAPCFTAIFHEFPSPSLPCFPGRLGKGRSLVLIHPTHQPQYTKPSRTPRTPAPSKSTEKFSHGACFGVAYFRRMPQHRFSGKNSSHSRASPRVSSSRESSHSITSGCSTSTRTSDAPPTGHPRASCIPQFALAELIGVPLVPLCRLRFQTLDASRASMEPHRQRRPPVPRRSPLTRP